MQLSSPKKKKKRSCKHKPIWPMNAVSIKEAIGSAAKASAAGIAICAISSPNSSFLKTLLAKQLGNYRQLGFIKSSPGVSRGADSAWTPPLASYVKP